MSVHSKEKRKKPTVVSLFTGAGGLDLGIESAGFEMRLCIEIDEDCQSTLRLNRPRWKLASPPDIHELSCRDILKQAGLRKRELSLLTGGPPCQPFSKAGYWINGDSARLDDPRSDTLAAYMRVVDAMLPTCVLLENVKGLGYKDKDEGIELLKARFKVINRKHKVNYIPQVVLINAADHGVPQVRERIFVVAHRRGKKFQAPAKTHCSHANCDFHACDKERYSTTWDAIGHLNRKGEAGEDLKVRGKWADLLPTIPEGANYLWHTPRSEGEPLFGWRTRYWSFLLKLAKHLPSWTIQASPGPATGPFHWLNRQLSIEELCRIQTFPADYKIVGARNSAFRQIGNAVPSAMGQVLGFEIRRQLLGQRCRLKRTFLPMQRQDVPRPENILAVPRKYLKLRGEHDEHPGVGLGPLAMIR